MSDTVESKRDWRRAVVAGCALGLAVACGKAALPGATTADLGVARERSPVGAQVYDMDCVTCHGEKGEGLDVNPPVMGEGALPVESADVPRISFHTAQDLFDYTKAEMPLPEEMVGTLSDEDCWAVTAYLLRGHGRQLPAEGLSAANAKQVRIDD